MLEPSEESNGCFLAVLHREVRSPKTVMSFLRAKTQSWVTCTSKPHQMHVSRQDPKDIVL